VGRIPALGQINVLEGDMSSGRIAVQALSALHGSSPTRHADLVKRAGRLTPRQVSNGLETLKKHGWALFANGMWHLTNAGRVAFAQGKVPHSGGAGNPRNVKISQKRTFRQRAWQALRRKGGKATIPDLLRILEGGDSKRQANNLGITLL